METTLDWTADAELCLASADSLNCGLRLERIAQLDAGILDRRHRSAPVRNEDGQSRNKNL